MYGFEGVCLSENAAFNPWDKCRGPGWLAGVGVPRDKRTSWSDLHRVRKKMPKIDTLTALSDSIRYAQDMPKICPIYAQYMPKICPRYAHDVPNMDPRDASTSKNLPVQELWWKCSKWKYGSFFSGNSWKFYWMKTFIAIGWWFEMEILTTLGPLSPHDSQSKIWNKIYGKRNFLSKEQAFIATFSFSPWESLNIFVWGFVDNGVVWVFDDNGVVKWVCEDDGGNLLGFWWKKWGIFVFFMTIGYFGIFDDNGVVDWVFEGNGLVDWVFDGNGVVFWGFWW